MTQPLLLNASPLPDIPWQDRPAGCSDVVWRYDANPIIPRDATPTSNSVFNSAVVPFGDGYAAIVTPGSSAATTGRGGWTSTPVSARTA